MRLHLKPHLFLGFRCLYPFWTHGLKHFPKDRYLHFCSWDEQDSLRGTITTHLLFNSVVIGTPMQEVGDPGPAASFARMASNPHFYLQRGCHNHKNIDASRWEHFHPFHKRDYGLAQWLEN